MAKNPSSNDAEQVFKKFDANGDGKISITELGSILNALGTVTPEEELKIVMKEIDKDGDGYIDLNEFIEFQRGGCSLEGDHAVDDEKELREAFNLYDQNKNGGGDCGAAMIGGGCDDSGITIIVLDAVETICDCGGMTLTFIDVVDGGMVVVGGGLPELGSGIVESVMNEERLT